MKSSAQYEWTAEDGSLIVRILVRVISTLAGEMGGRAGGHAKQDCGVLVGTASSDGTPVVTVESIAALPIEAGSSGAGAIQLLFDKWPRSQNRRVHAVGSYRIARPGAAEPSQRELPLTKGSTGFPAVELTVEGPTGGGIAGSICFQTRADGPIHCERLVFPLEHHRPPAPAQLPSPAAAAAGSFRPLDEGTNEAYVARPSSWSRRVGIVVGTVAVVSVAGMAIKPNGLKPGIVQSDVHMERVSTDLGLSAERFGGNLIATWNRQAQGIVNATNGVLSVQDLDGRHDLTLDREQLRSGSAVYPATTDDVTIRLQVFDSKRNTEVGTLRVISPANRRDVVPREDEVQPLVPAAQPAARNRPKPFQTPDPRGSRATLPPTPIPDVPPDAPLPPRPAPVELASVMTPAVKPAPPRPERIGVGEPSGGRSEVPAVQQQGLGVKIQTSEQLNNTVTAPLTSAPVSLFPVSPVLSSNVRALIHKRFEVTVTVKVDTSGRVTDATAVVASANSLGVLGDFIRAAAINAARLWRFEPARANQHSVPGTCDIKFEFGPN
jgi:Gram-negative bacterial TonB protein C-terminal